MTSILQSITKIENYHFFYAIFRWLKFDDLANPSPLALEELNAIRTYLSNQ